MLYYFMSYNVMLSKIILNLCHLISYHIVSYRITSHYIILYHLISLCCSRIDSHFCFSFLVFLSRHDTRSRSSRARGSDAVRVGHTSRSLRKIIIGELMKLLKSNRKEDIQLLWSYFSILSSHWCTLPK